MNAIQVKMLEAKIKHDQLMKDYENGVNVPEEKEDQILTEYVDASLALEKWVTPILVNQSKNRSKPLTEKDVENLFKYELERTIELTLRLKL